MDSAKTRIVNQLKAEIATHLQQRRDHGALAGGNDYQSGYIDGCLDSYRYALQIVRNELQDGG